MSFTPIKITEVCSSVYDTYYCSYGHAIVVCKVTVSLEEKQACLQESFLYMVNFTTSTLLTAVWFRLAVLSASQKYDKETDEENITYSEILIMIFDGIQSHTRNFKIR